MKSLLNIFLLSTFSIFMVGQDITTKDVKNEKKFIEALKENSIGRHDKAEKLLKELYEDDRTNADIAFELAKTYDRLGDQILVEKYAKNAINNDPNNLWYHEYYGNLMMKENRPLSAISSFNKMIEIEPQNHKHYDRLAKAYILNNEEEKAISTFNQMENRFGPFPEIILNKFRVYDNQNDFINAINELDKLIKTYPNNEDYLLTKAKVLLKSGDQENAKKTYLKVLDIDPNNTEANIALLGQGNKIENENSYLRALLPIIENKSIPVDAKVKELLPYIEDLTQNKNIELKDALIEAGDRLVQTHPKEAKAYAAFGDILYNTGNIKGAIQKYQKTITLDDTVFPVWNQLMYALLEDENYSELLRVSEESIDLFPNQASAFNFYGLALTYASKFEEGVSILEEGILITGGNKVMISTIHNSIGFNYLEQKKFDKAKEEIEKALEISNQKNPLSFELLGDYYFEINDKTKALNNWNKSQSMGNSSKKLILKIEAIKK